MGFCTHHAIIHTVMSEVAPINGNNDNNMVFVGTSYFIIGPSSMISSLPWSLAVLGKPRTANDHVRLLIIDVGPIIKYNALQNHVIVILKTNPKTN